MASVVAKIAPGQEYTQDGPEAQTIASVIPYYPFHGVPRFYDISGMTHNPEVFQLCIDVFVRRYRELGIDCVAGLDARGFVLGPPIALALKKPFIMIRKVGKLPNAVTGSQYYKEYQGANAAGGDELCISRTAIVPGARVLVIGKTSISQANCSLFLCSPYIKFLPINNLMVVADDLIATGGTLIAACDLLASVGATIVECACMVELKMLGGYGKLQAKHPSVKVQTALIITMH